MKRLLLLATLPAVLAACLDVPSGPTPECATTADCDSASGEVCEEGVCWGNPPEGVFAAVVSPPADRKDLVAKELTQLLINEAGWINGLMLEKPVMLSGRIEAACTAPMICDRTALEATITVTRASQFQGGPGFKTVTQSDSGGTEGPSFEVALPRSREGDAAYLVTVMPDGRGDEPSSGGMTAAQLVPPMRFEIEVPSDLTRTIQLGGSDLPTIDGQLVTGNAVGLSNYRVVALGHWETGAPVTEVSTVDYTGADGVFRLVLSRNLVGNVEIVAKPYGDQLAPTLHLGSVPATGSSTRTLVQPPGLGNPVEITVPVKGKDGSGEIGPVRGARVRVVAAVGAQTTGVTYATFDAEGTTDDEGKVTLELLDGVAINEAYRLEIVPPASSNVGVMFDQPLTTSTYSATRILPARVPIRGAVTDVYGNPLKDVSVTARPSLRFLWSLDDVPQQFLSAIPAATAVTPSTGEFVLWVDPTVAGLWGHYDLVFEPAMSKYPTRAPTWVQGDIEIPRDTALRDVTIPEIRLPDAAFVHGVVTDVNGEQVQGAEVKVFRVSTSLALCSMVLNAPLTCPIPAQLQGRGAADSAGIVRLTLPR